MFALLLILFCVVPLIELWLLFAVAHRTSAWFTLLLVVATGVVGAWLARLQGFRTLRRIEQELAAQRIPATALVDGVMILAAGLMLLTPGILTDLIGFSLLIPPVRALYRKWLVRYFRNRIQVGAGRFDDQGRPERSDAPRSRVIDVQIVESADDAQDAT